MKITTLIQFYQFVLRSNERHIYAGFCDIICWSEFIKEKFDKETLAKLYKVFDREKGYYQNYFDKRGSSYLFSPGHWSQQNTRDDFMRTEIKDLKRLLKLGYTHV